MCKFVFNINSAVICQLKAFTTILRSTQNVVYFLLPRFFLHFLQVHFFHALVLLLSIHISIVFSSRPSRAQSTFTRYRFHFATPAATAFLAFCFLSDFTSYISPITLYEHVLHACNWKRFSLLRVADESEEKEKLQSLGKSEYGKIVCFHWFLWSNRTTKCLINPKQYIVCARASIYRNVERHILER